MATIVWASLLIVPAIAVGQTGILGEVPLRVLPAGKGVPTFDLPGPDVSPGFLRVVPLPAGSLSTTGGHLRLIDAHSAGHLSRLVTENTGPGLWEGLTCADDDPSTPGGSPDRPCGLNMANPAGYYAREAWSNRESATNAGEDRYASDGSSAWMRIEWDCSNPISTPGGSLVEERYIMASPTGLALNFDPMRNNPPYGSVHGQVREINYGLGEEGAGGSFRCDTNPGGIVYGGLESEAQTFTGHPGEDEETSLPSDRTCEAPTDASLTRYVVGFWETPDSSMREGTYNGASVERVNVQLRFAAVDVPPHQYASFYERVSRDPNVRYCHPDYPERIAYTPNDAMWSDPDLDGMRLIRADDAWDVTLGSPNKVICVADTGVRYTHEDLQNRWINGYDFVNSDADPMDDNGHGTHVAGTAVGTTDNGVGVAGVAQVGIKAVKVFSASGSGSSSLMADGFTWCADNGADIITYSGGGPDTATKRTAVQYAKNAGLLLVAAAGNGGPCVNCVSSPGDYPEVIGVPSLQRSTAQCTASSDGSESEVSAPGEDVLSTWWTGDAVYNAIPGCWTSMATPHVSGTAALVWSHLPTLTADEVRLYLTCSAQDINTAGWDEETGYGMVDARTALDYATAGSCLGPPPGSEECGAAFLLTGDDVGSKYHGPTTVQVLHSGSDHVVGSPTVTANPAPSDPTILGVDPAGHDAWVVTLWESGGPDREITFSVTLACGKTHTAQWMQYN